MKASDFSQPYPGKLVPIKNGDFAFLPDSLPMSLLVNRELRMADEKANRALGRLQAIIPSLPNPALITTPFMRREAVLSSKIEGTKTKMAGLFLFEELHGDEDDSSNSASDEVQDAKEVHNYVVAQDFGFRSLKDVPLCMRVLCEMHKKLMHGIPGQHGFDKTPGQYRKTQAFIGPGHDIRDARFIAPPPDEVESLMSDLEKFIHSPNELSTLMAIALIHYQFESIHPFFDGNGRLGRLLISLLLASHGILEDPILYLSAFFEKHKEDYVRLLLRVSTHGAWGEWVSFFLTGVESVADDAVQRAKTVLSLREKYRSKFQGERATSVKRLELIDGLFRWPVISIKRAMESLDMTHQGATKHVQKLQADGVLEEVTGFRRNRLFIANEIVDLMS